MKFGCHGSTWELDYDKECDYLDQIMDTVKDAGFKGVDVQVALLGRYNNDPERLKAQLAQRGLVLAALTVPFTWAGEKESDEERKHADYYINFLQHFPGAVMNIPARVGPNRNNLLKRQKEIIRCVNTLGKRAHENGVVASFHPASPATSYFRTIEDYEVLFQELDRNYLSYTPDAGHIKAGGMEPIEIIKDNLSIIKHVHFKDCSHTLEWRKMGTGDIDFPAIIEILHNSGYNGWVMVEEETEEAAKDPDKVIVDVGEYVESRLVPIAKGIKSRVN